jgi:ABC-type glycerol-3-phosphate transport system permease component
MAAATAATAPIVILFFFAQRTFIQGIAIQGTGAKG